MKRKYQKNNKGFTLVELIIVIAIIAILLALITPNLTAFLGTAEDTAEKANAKTAYSSAFAWATSEKAAGRTVTAGTVTITKGESTLTTNPATTYDGVLTYFVADEITKGTTIAIVFGDNNSVTSVTWTEGGTGTGSTYPAS